MFKVFLSYFALKAVNVVISIFGIYILTREMSPYEYGIYSYGLTFLIVISAILFEWIASSVARFYPSNPSSILSTSLMVYLRETSILFVMGFFILLIVTLFGLSILEQYNSFYIFVVIFAFSILGGYSIYAQLLNSREKVFLYNALNALRQSLSIGAALIMIYFGFNAEYYYLSFAAGSILAVFFIIVVNKRNTKPVIVNLNNFKIEKSFYSYGIPVSILFASILIIDFSDRIFISYFLSYEQLAIYSASYDLIQKTFGAILGIAYIAYFPRIVSYWESQEKSKSKLLLSNLFYIVFILGTYICIFIFVSYDYLSLLIGEEIRQTPIHLAPLIAIGILFGALKFYVLDIDFKLTNNILLLIKISVIMILFNLIANYISIPLFGILGAAASTALTFFLGSITAYFFSSRIIPKKTFIYLVLKVLFALVSAFFLNAFIVYYFDISAIFESLLLALIFTLLLFFLKIKQYYVSM